MKKKILIIVGDNLGLKRDQIDYEDLEIVKFPTIVDGKEYRENEEYNASWLISKYVNENVVAMSSTLPQKDIVEIIEKNHSKYDLIIHVVMSSGLSAASFKVAENIRKQYENIIPIINVDSRQPINGVGNVLLGIIDMIKENNDLSIEEITKLCQQVVERTYTYFVFPDLNYLYKGGRIGKAQSLMGSVLHIIPIVGAMGDNEEGIILPCGKGRTFKQVNLQVMGLIKEKMKEKSVDKIKRAIVVYGYGDNNQDAIADFVEKAKSLPCEKFIIGKPGLVDAVYCGPGAYMISVYLK
ncbi:MAG TPA: DegV family protein [Paludibacteraceae bacterium]|nr:DegV family protein [Paludibacteraceae bacterium]HOV84145.1 DegV family protein [Paludibacteraceae bacterium]HPO67340.1 DegV family protein [Paludibacteraceae bacterium]